MGGGIQDSATVVVDVVAVVAEMFSNPAVVMGVLFCAWGGARVSTGCSADAGRFGSIIPLPSWLGRSLGGALPWSSWPSSVGRAVGKAGSVSEIERK